jgi:hypothetical protein
MGPHWWFGGIDRVIIEPSRVHILALVGPTGAVVECRNKRCMQMRALSSSEAKAQVRNIHCSARGLAMKRHITMVLDITCKLIINMA